MAELIDTPEAFARAVDELRAHPALALDTETDAFFAYRPRICLLQASVPGSDFLIDPLAGLDPAPLGALLADPGRRVVLHASENDVIMMRHEFGWRIAALFDTQVAGFVLGIRPYSLAGILEARFGLRLDKRQQRSDWSKRPLSPEQLRYAADDTRHLLKLADDFLERARAANRLEEIEAECRRIAGRDWEPEAFDPEQFRRLAGARDLDPVAQRVLRELFVFRHRISDRRNRAPYRVISDAALVALARWRPGSPPPRGVPPQFWRRHGPRVGQLVEKARARGPLPRRARPRRPEGDSTPPEVKQAYERLRCWRRETAAQRGVESWVVARNELLMRIARARCRTRADLARELEPFRLREYGDAILAALLETGADRSDNAGRT